MICLSWVGGAEADEETMEQTRAQLERAFSTPVARCGRAEPPSEALDPRRRQLASGRLLSWVASRVPAGAERVLAVTDQDLFIPVLTFVFGEAMLGGPAAVSSTARLGRGPEAGSRALLRARLAKVCAHELGHTFGLLHCPRSACVMARSASVAEIDEKGPAFCADCRSRLEAGRKRGVERS